MPGIINAALNTSLPEVMQLPPADRDAALAAMSHADLLNLRSKVGDNTELQNIIGPFEHRAFAREETQDSLLRAAGLAVAIPAYTASKAMGLSKSRSGASLDELEQGYAGIADGLKTRLAAL